MSIRCNNPDCIYCGKHSFSESLIPPVKKPLTSFNATWQDGYKRGCEDCFQPIVHRINELKKKMDYKNGKPTLEEVEKLSLEERYEFITLLEIISKIQRKVDGK